MKSIKELEGEAGITVELAITILGMPESITFSPALKYSCKLGVLSMRELQRREEDPHNEQGTD